MATHLQGRASGPGVLDVVAAPRPAAPVHPSSGRAAPVGTSGARAAPALRTCAAELRTAHRVAAEPAVSRAGVWVLASPSLVYGRPVCRVRVAAEMADPADPDPGVSCRMDPVGQGREPEARHPLREEHP